MVYKIKPYTFIKARKLGIVVKPSKNKNKKIDIFSKNGEYITSIGANGYSDYPTFIEEYGIKYADYRRKLYKKRHQRDRKVKYSKGWFADFLLW